jgi:hypothetical protein
MPMAPTMRTRLGIPAAVVLGAALLLGSAGTASARAVTPAGYAAQVCAAVASAHQATQAAAAPLNAAAAAYKSAPSTTTATGLRDALVGEIQTLDRQMASISTTVRQAGEPTGAPGFSAALLAQLAKAHAAAQQLAQQAAAIDVSSPAAFQSSVQQVLAAIEKVSADERASAKANPALAHPIKALRPLAHFMTTKVDTCTKR